MGWIKRTILLAVVLLMAPVMAGRVAATKTIFDVLRGSGLVKNGNSYTEFVEALFDVKQGGALSLGTSNGSVRINTWDRDQIRLVVTKTAKKGNPYKARTVLEDFLVRARHQGGNLDLEARANTEECKRGVGVTFTVWVPKNYNIDVKTGKGDVDIGELDGSFRAKTADGKISFDCEPNGMDIEIEDRKSDSNSADELGDEMNEEEQSSGKSSTSFQEESDGTERP